jgi:uncharacterized protein YlaI
VARTSRKRTCRGKVRYRDHQEAVTALHTLQSKSTRQQIPVRSYDCEECGGVHVTKQVIHRNSRGRT